MSDPHEANVQLLLHFDGAEGGDVFLDSSQVGRELYATSSNGVTTTTAHSRFGGGSLSLWNSSNKLVIPYAPQAPADFTLECWVRLTEWASATLYGWASSDTSSSLNNPVHRLATDDSTRTIYFHAGSPIGETILLSGQIPADQFVHVALVRSGNTLSLYVAGSLAASYSGASGIDFNHPFAAISGDDAWVDEMRFTSGVARYEGSSFTVPSAPFEGPSPGKVGAWVPSTQFGTTRSNYFSWRPDGVWRSEGWMNHPAFIPIDSWDDLLVAHYPTFGGSLFQSPDIVIPEGVTTIPIVVSKTSIETPEFSVRLVPASNPHFELSGSTVLWAPNIAVNDTDVSFDLPVQSGVWRLSFSVYLPSPGGYVRIKHLGLPSSFVAQGFNASQFGTPLETGLRASGFQSGLFGVPNAGGETTLGVVTKLGSPTSHVVYRASSVGDLALFGMPDLINFDTTLDAQGFAPTVFGSNAYANGFQPTIRNMITAARGVRVTQFGQASTPVTQFAGASGWQASGLGRPMTTPRPMSIFGRPTMARRLAAQGFGIVSVGTPRAGSVTRPDSLRPVRFGTPTAPPSYVARHVRRSARFGRPSAARSGHLTFGFSLHGRFGRPRVGTVRYVPLGFACAVFGLPVRRPAQRALHVPPNTRFGTPLMTRGM